MRNAKIQTCSLLNFSACSNILRRISLENNYLSRKFSLLSYNFSPAYFWNFFSSSVGSQTVTAYRSSSRCAFRKKEHGEITSFADNALADRSH